MKEEKWLGKKIRTANHCYLYDVWTNQLLETDEKVFALLADQEPYEACGKANGDPLAQQEVTDARARGFLSPAMPDICCFSQDRVPAYLDQLRRKGPDHLTLNLTRRCNLSCRYCAYSGAYEGNPTHGADRMSEEVITAALDFYFSFSQKSQYSIGFYGGEPLLEAALLRKAIRQARAKAPAEVVFRLTTNGTLLDEEMCRFLIEEDVRLMISIDGPPAVHDRYRRYADGRGTFADVWQGILRIWEMDSRYAEQRISYNVVAAAPLALAEIQAFWQAYPQIFSGQRLSIVKVNGHPSTLPAEIVRDEVAEFEKKRDRLYQEFKKRALTRAWQDEDVVTAMFRDDFLTFHQRSNLRLENPAPSHGQCLPGDPKCMVDIDGALYMCERVGVDRKIGTVWDGYSLPAVEKILADYNALFSEACRGCWALRLCNKCFVHFRQEDTFATERLADFCRSMRKRWHWIIARYCELREEDPEIFRAMNDAGERR